MEQTEIILQNENIEDNSINVNEDVESTSEQTITLKEDEEKTKKQIRQEKINNRIWEIDLIRGICIILMIFDHLMFDVFFYCEDFLGKVVPYGGFLEKCVDFANWYWTWTVRKVVRYVVVFLFFSLSGICSNFSKSNIKRGLITLAVAYGLTIGTYFFNLYEVGDKIQVYYQNVIWFGVLHCFGYSMLITGIIQKFKADGKAPLFIWAIIIGTIGIIFMCFKTTLFDLVYGIWGRKTDFFYTNDFFGLFPHLAIFFLGVVLGKILYNERVSLFDRGNVSFIKPIKFVGRHALWFYLGHQAVFISIIFIFRMIFL